MKKTVLSIVLTAALALGIAMPVRAANDLPVFVEGQKVAEPAQVLNNTSYLPMRAIYEALGAKVDWDAKNQRVIATEPSGTWTEIPLKGDWMEVHYSASSSSQANLEGRRPFTKGGKVYLPVRLVSDAMGYEVDYNKQRVAITSPKLTYKDGQGGVYMLNLLNGELKLSQNGGVKRLGEVAMPSNRGFHSAKLYDFKVEQTKNGNYLFSGGGVLYGALTNGLEVYAWLPKDGSRAVTVYSASVLDPLPKPCWVGDVLWLPGEGSTYAIDEKTNKITEYKAADIYGDEYYGMCYWTDGRFMLMGDGADFDVYDIKTKELIDLQKVMLEPDIKAQVQTFMQQNSWGTKTPEQFEKLWQYFGNTMATLPGGDEAVYLRFVRAADNVLYFDLVVHYWDIDENGGIAGGKDKTFHVTYTLPE